MSKRDDGAGKARQPYEKPRLKRFPLATGEVLAAGSAPGDACWEPSMTGSDPGKGRRAAS